MKDPNYHDYYKIVMRTMKKGETAWIKFTKKYTNGVYHMSSHFQSRSQEDKDKIGEDIYIRMSINNIKRNPVNSNPATYEGRLSYFKRIREICKDLIEEGEHTNASTLYSRCLGEF